MRVESIRASSTPAQQVLATHGKTFRFAQLFLQHDTARDAARLYKFCRLLDDAVDEMPVGQAATIVASVRQDIIKQTSTTPWVQDFLSLQAQYQISSQPVLHMLDYFVTDLSKVSINTERELIQYCYGVAGTVGRLMRPMLGASEASEAYAIDLGIAMQLTNIARDVLEDAQRGRRYIPGEWIAGLDTYAIIHPTHSQNALVQHAVMELLVLAERYYKSASKGLVAIPANNRRAIAVALMVYREIGLVIAENNYNYLDGRCYVSTTRKAKVALSALWNFAFMSDQLPSHQYELHLPLIELLEPKDSAA